MPTLRISIARSYDICLRGVNQTRWHSPGGRCYLARMADVTATTLSAARAALDAALETGRRTTDGGKAIDEHQVHAERLAYAATEVAAAEALAAYAAARREAGQADATTDLMAAAFAAETADRLRARIE